jgi:hypothetical protein
MINDEVTTLPSRKPIEFVACEHLYHLGEFQVLFLVAEYTFWLIFLSSIVYIKICENYFQNFTTAVARMTVVFW